MNRTLRHCLILLTLVCLSILAPGIHAQPGRPPHHPDAALDRLKRIHGPVRARVDRRSGEVRFLQGKFGSSRGGPAEATARQFFADFGDLFGLRDPARELALRAVDGDKRGYASVRFRQQLGGVPVLGGDIRAEVDALGELHTIHGRLLPEPQPASLKPSITAAAATGLARQAVGLSGRLEGAPELLVARSEDSDHLVWRVRLRTDEPARWQILIDALDGTVVERQDILAEAKARLTYSADFSDLLPGTLARSEGQAATGDVDVNAAHDNAGLVYDYFWSNFGRDSIDGAGMPIVSSVHYKQNYNNAFWDGARIVYGDGDGQQFAPLDRALDIAAHELTHGITERTADLLYFDQPGALNEAISDIFAALVDTSNWEIGEAVVTPGTPGDAVRSLADPTRYGQPRVWGEYIDTVRDNGGVHRNNGIINHVAYIIATQIGRPKLGQIFYRTLTTKLTSSSDFEDVRDLALQSCIELQGSFGIMEGDCRAVQSAFARAGIGDAPAPPAAQRYRLYLPAVASRTQPCGDNLLQNGDFEAGQTAWPNTGAVIGSWNGHTQGTYSAKLEGSAQILQLVALPPDADRLTITALGYGEAGAEATASLEDVTTRATIATATLAPGATGRWASLSANLNGAANRGKVRLVVRHFGSGGALYLDDVRVSAPCATP
jgi:Zn-dependent metalloprotease